MQEDNSPKRLYKRYRQAISSLSDAIDGFSDKCRTRGPSSEAIINLRDLAEDIRTLVDGFRVAVAILPDIAGRIAGGLDGDKDVVDALVRRTVSADKHVFLGLVQAIELYAWALQEHMSRVGEEMRYLGIVENLGVAKSAQEVAEEIPEIVVGGFRDLLDELFRVIPALGPGDLQTNVMDIAKGVSQKAEQFFSEYPGWVESLLESATTASSRTVAQRHGGRGISHRPTSDVERVVRRIQS